MRRSPILVALVLAMAFSSAAQATGEEVVAEPPGLLIMEIDGLSEPVLRSALESGAMPFVNRLIESGSHIQGGWQTTAASTTTVTQAGILHGRWQDIPGFRWWDRDLGQLINFLDPEDARIIEDLISGPDDLLASDGASIANLFSGGAPRTVLTASHLVGPGPMLDVLRYLADPSKVRYVLGRFVDGLQADLLRTARGQALPFSSPAVERKAAVPIVGPALEWVLTDVVAASVIREVQGGAPIMYASFSSYDEVGHYAGPDHPVAIETLTHIDDALGLIAATAEQAPRPYRLVIISDHGQTGGDPFELRYGETLTEVVQGLMSAEPGGDADGDSPELIVAASGNLAHIYFPGRGQRSSVEEIEVLHPALLAGLVAHPGVGVVVVQAGDAGLVALGPGGSHELATGRIEGIDPLGHYGPLAAESMVNIAASRNAGDLVAVSMYDPVADEVASFEPQIGSHGGIGGPQTQAILVYPADLEPTAEPLALEGVDAVRSRILEWLAVSPSTGSSATSTPAVAPPPNAHLGEQVCATSAVTGAVGKLCARRDRFGASWTMELTDEEADGQNVAATVSLEVAGAPDPSEKHENDEGMGETLVEDGLFSPRAGTSIGKIAIETCVVARFRRDRCRTESVTLPQLASQGTPAQLARLRSLAFDQSIEGFMTWWRQEERSGVDLDFDWESDGCSAGPLAGRVDDRLEEACLRHDFAYRNFGNLFYDPTDSVRKRADEQLAEDAIALGQSRLAVGLTAALQQFGGPVFFGAETTVTWSIPSFFDS